MPPKRKVSIAPMIISQDEAASSSSREGDQLNRFRTMASAIAKQFTCSISQELMVDPVIAEDGKTYDRAGIEQWLQTHTTSPLDPSCTLTTERLLSNRAVREAIEALVESSDIDEDTCDEWREKKRSLLCHTLDLKRAQELFDAGRVMDAAKLGLPKAQGIMATRFYSGKDGEVKDLDKCFECATKAARGGDKDGQFRLGYAYYGGEGVEQNWIEALKWYELAAAQGCKDSMYNIGVMHEIGRHGVPQDDQKAFDWYRKAGEYGDDDAVYEVGTCYYNGKGVSKDLVEARTWFHKGSSRAVECKFMLGFMKVRGEGGPMKIIDGMTLVEATAKDGCAKANDLLAKFIETGAAFVL